MSLVVPKQCVPTPCAPGVIAPFEVSDCPVRPMSSELFGMKHSMGLLTYGDCLRQIRKNIGHRLAVDINPIKDIETHPKRVFSNPEQLQVRPLT